MSYAMQKYFANHLPKLVVFYPLILETLTVLDLSPQVSPMRLGKA